MGVSTEISKVESSRGPLLLADLSKLMAINLSGMSNPRHLMCAYVLYIMESSKRYVKILLNILDSKWQGCNLYSE